MDFKFTLEELKIIEKEHQNGRASHTTLCYVLKDAIKARETVEKARVLAHLIKELEQG
jgi:hypothetical protein